MNRIILALVVFLSYALLPTKNYYWDGISFSITIENAHHWTEVLHPNHLIYSLPGWIVYKLLGGTVRALYILQFLNALFGALAVYAISGLGRSITRSASVGLLLALAFAVSGTFWRFATDADAYILSVLLLCCCARLLIESLKPRPFAVALLHAAAMLIHELSVFFFPAALYLLWRKQRRAAVLYFITVVIATVSAYGGAFWLQHGSWDTRAFLTWTSSHALDVSFSFQILRDLKLSAVSWLQLIAIGRPALVSYKDPLTIILLALLLATLTLLIIDLRRTGRASTDSTSGTMEIRAFALIRIATYAIFLLFWLPNNTFYKLFALPAIIVLTATYCKQNSELNLRSPSVWAVVSLGLFNLTFGIIPYSHANANAAVAFALNLHKPLAESSKTVVYFKSMGPDDNFVKYFTPSADWQPIAGTDSIDSSLREGKDVWLDTSAVDALSATDPSWFQRRTAPSAAEWHERVDAKHHIRFVRLKKLS